MTTSPALEALEEFYERMPPEARPAVNGEVDPGDAALAAKLRSWCLQREGEGGMGDGGHGHGKHLGESCEKWQTPRRIL